MLLRCHPRTVVATLLFMSAIFTAPVWAGDQQLTPPAAPAPAATKKLEALKTLPLTQEINRLVRAGKTFMVVFSDGSQKEGRAANRRNVRIESVEQSSLMGRIPILLADLSIEGTEKEIYSPILGEEAVEQRLFIKNGGVVLMAWCGRGKWRPHPLNNGIHMPSQVEEYVISMIETAKADAAAEAAHASDSPTTGQNKTVTTSTPDSTNIEHSTARKAEVAQASPKLPHGEVAGTTPKE